MTKAFDSIQHAANGQLDAVTMDLTSFTTIFQAIVADGTDTLGGDAESGL